MEVNVTQKQNSNKSFLKKAGKHGTINDMNGVRWMLCEHSEIGNVLELTHTHQPDVIHVFNAPGFLLCFSVLLTMKHSGGYRQ